MNFFGLFGNAVLAKPVAAQAAARKFQNYHRHDGKIITTRPPKIHRGEYKEEAVQSGRLNFSNLRELLKLAPPLMLIPAAAAKCLNSDLSNWYCLNVAPINSNAAYIVATQKVGLINNIFDASVALAKIGFRVVADSSFNDTNFITDELCDEDDPVTGLIAGPNTSLSITPPVRSLMNFVNNQCTQMNDESGATT